MEGKPSNSKPSDLHAAWRKRAHSKGVTRLGKPASSAIWAPAGGLPELQQQYGLLAGAFVAKQSGTHGCVDTLNRVALDDQIAASSSNPRGSTTVAHGSGSEERSRWAELNHL